ncbi:hypothetical protein BKA70DRAFT_1525570 [Coprinopsis sp. MPI-PUGE-AT-0042]|nr:hypothetical protein BKA70DRAFT_1525570 [Coprinopsis sp. MPI-PUGE-AT-0042]
MEGSSIFGRCTKIELNNCHITNYATGAYSNSVDHYACAPWSSFPSPPLIHVAVGDNLDGLLPPPVVHSSGENVQTRFGRFAIAGSRAAATSIIANMYCVADQVWARLDSELHAAGYYKFLHFHQLLDGLIPIHVIHPAVILLLGGLPPFVLATLNAKRIATWLGVSPPGWVHRHPTNSPPPAVLEPGRAGAPETYSHDLTSA